jgi:hypothetical protein
VDATLPIADEANDDRRRDLLARLEQKVFWEHIMSFVPAYLTAMLACGVEFYAGWASRLAHIVHQRAKEIGGPDALPQHLALASPLADAGTPGALENFGALLSPVRSGMILVRDELLDYARAKGLKRHARDRATLLGELIERYRGEFLGRLAGRAAEWADIHRGHPFGILNDEWAPGDTNRQVPRRRRGVGQHAGR